MCVAECSATVNWASIEAVRCRYGVVNHGISNDDSSDGVAELSVDDTRNAEGFVADSSGSNEEFSVRNRCKCR